MHPHSRNNVLGRSWREPPKKKTYAPHSLLSPTTATTYLSFPPYSQVDYFRRSLIAPQLPYQLLSIYLLGGFPAHFIPCRFNRLSCLCFFLMRLVSEESLEDIVVGVSPGIYFFAMPHAHFSCQVDGLKAARAPSTNSSG